MENPRGQSAANDLKKKKSSSQKTGMAAVWRALQEIVHSVCFYIYFFI